MDFARDSLRSVACFVLAGGVGERLLPLTVSTPKPLLMFGGLWCLLDFTLSNVSNSGVPGAYILSQYRQNDIEAYLGARWTPTSRQPTAFLNQPPRGAGRYQGTAHAVARNLDCAEPETDLVLVLSADHVYRMDYRPMIERHRESHASVTVGVCPVAPEAARQFGVLSVGSGGRIVDFVEKPENPPSAGPDGSVLANMGVYVFDRRVLARTLAVLGRLGGALDFGRDVLPYLVAGGDAEAYFAVSSSGAAGYWRDVGTPDAYHASNMDLLGEDLFQRFVDSAWPIRLPVMTSVGSAHPEAPPWRGSIVVSRVTGDCRIERSVVGPGVTIEDGAQVYGSVLLPGAHIGRGAVVRNAIVDAGVTIAEGEAVGCSPAMDSRFERTDEGVLIVTYRRKGMVFMAPQSGQPHHSGPRLHE